MIRQRPAECLDLRAEFPEYRTQMSSDHVPGSKIDPWNIEIPCKWGAIYPYGGEYLCAYTDRKRLRTKLLAIDGVEEHQIADFETIVRFHKDQFEEVARVMGAKKKRVTSEEQLAAMREGRLRAKNAKSSSSFKTDQIDRNSSSSRPGRG